MGNGDAGKNMPQGQGIDYSNGFDAETIVGNNPLTAEEAAVFGHKDADDNSIDVFFVESFSPAAQALVGARGRSYSASFSGGNASYKNNVACTSVAEIFTLPHEFLHILLNRAHRQNEPTTALFRGGTTTDKRVNGTKRIGPYPDAVNTNVGKDDTTNIRAVSESLPQQ